MKKLRKSDVFVMIGIMALFVVLIAAGCGGGGGGGGTATTGSLTIRVADAPVDDALAVVVVFTGVEIKPAAGNSIDIDFDSPRQIDLLALNGVSTVLINGVELEAGQYNWIRLKVEAERGVIDSYIDIDDGEGGFIRESLYVPSGSQSGLKLNRPFMVAAGGITDFTLDFDLRKSVHDPQGFPDYILRPTIRILDSLQIGGMTGMVNAALLNATGGNAVYVYTGFDVVPDDVGSPTEPINTAIVDPVTGQYSMGLLAIGNYTAAFTNAADMDDPDTDDDIPFFGATNFTVTADSSTVVNIE